MENFFCFIGFFISGETNKNGETYFGSIQFPEIKLPEELNDYEISYYFYMYCNDCENNPDFFRIIFNQDETDEEYKREEIFSYERIGNNQKIWIKESVKFLKYEKSNIDVKFYFI